MVVTSDVIPLVLYIWGGGGDIVFPKRSRWLVKPELLLDHCVQLTRTARHRR